MPRGESIPTRFEIEEEATLNQLKVRTGLSKSEIIRRAVRLLRIEIDRRGEIGFIIEELSPSQHPASTHLPSPPSPQHTRLNEEPPLKKRAK